MNSRKFISVSRLAATLGTTPRAIRLWESKGLLGFVERDKGGARLYSKPNVDSASIVMAASEAGMTLDEARSYVEGWTEEYRRDLRCRLHEKITRLGELADGLPEPDQGHYDL